MSGLLICAGTALAGAGLIVMGSRALTDGDKGDAAVCLPSGLALIAVALWLAYAAGGAP